MSAQEKPRQRPGALKRAGLWIKRTATFLYGPPDLPDEVDPVADLDERLGRDPHPTQDPKLTERQQSYENLPRGHE
jgi:hypothetical protein